MNQGRQDYSCFIAFTGFESDALIVSHAVVIAISTKTITFEPDISTIKRLTYATKQTPSQTPSTSSWSTPCG